jgi:hypothetical protein
VWHKVGLNRKDRNLSAWQVVSELPMLFTWFFTRFAAKDVCVRPRWFSYRSNEIRVRPAAIAASAPTIKIAATIILDGLSKADLSRSP